MEKNKVQEKGADEQYCSSCGAIIKKEAEFCVKCGVKAKGKSAHIEGSGSPSKVVAGILAILLGGIGVHKFYLGHIGLGIIYLCFFWTGIPLLLGLVEGIIYLAQSDEAFYENYVKNKKAMF